MDLGPLVAELLNSCPTNSAASGALEDWVYSTVCSVLLASRIPNTLLFICIKIIKIYDNQIKKCNYRYEFLCEFVFVKCF